MPEDNMYDDGPAQQPPPSGGPEAQAGKSEGGGQTFLLPKEVLQGKKFDVGDELVLKIAGMHGDSVEVAYAPEKGKEGEEEYEGDREAEAPQEEQPQAPPPGAGNVPQGDMAAMMQ
jgi:hypothetical protein